MQDSPNFYSPKVSSGKFAKVFLRQTFALYGIVEYKIRTGKYMIKINLLTPYIYVVIYKNNLLTSITKNIGGNHFKRYITCANYEFLFSKNTLSFQNIRK